jgi:2,3-bisphosphoglycerate-independent phosphoglycerate mutase
VRGGPRRLPAPCTALIVLDGWGLAHAGEGNAISLANTPVVDQLWSLYPHARLQASGRAVGLPRGQMGNSEVGHLSLGAGAVVNQDLTRIDDAVAGGELSGNEVLRDALAGAERVHLIGLVSEGGVHSGFTHLEALIRLGAQLGVRDLVLHAFTDGRDTLPISGARYLETVEGWMADAGAGRVGSVVGRYYAMDRDRRWERVQRAYDLLVHGRAEHRADTGAVAARTAYRRGETDEFITPVIVGPEARISPHDSVIAFNFRPDRMREITRALADPGFDEVDRGGASSIERYATMTRYEDDFAYPVVFPPEHPATTLPLVLEQAGLTQLHVAETEKYAHVTYFFNGGDERACEGERRVLVPSARDVPTYDCKPEMSAARVAEAFVDAWRSDAPAFGIINFANADMVGHTGNIEATIKGVETVDRCVGEVVDAVHDSGGACLITADHGNAEHMREPDRSPNTAHTSNLVPLIVTVHGLNLCEEGILGDVAPTALAVLGLAQPTEMTGQSLIEAREAPPAGIGQAAPARAETEVIRPRSGRG